MTTRSVLVGRIPTQVAEEVKATRSLSAIAEEIRENWNKVSRGGVGYAAKPYLDAMDSLGNVEDNYYQDLGRSIVAYFLANAQGWRGEVAKRIKAELKGMIGEK